MKNKRSFKLVKQAMTATLALTTLLTFVGCAREVDCSIEGEHVHLFVNEEISLSRYINSEKEYIGDLFRTDDYLEMTDDLKIVDKNKLYVIKDNAKYLTSKISESSPYRQAYSYDYIYGSYVGYGYGINPTTGKSEYYNGLHTGWHYGYEWKDISLDEYTSDKVRDITYKFKFYKINEDGTISSKLFNSLDEVTEEYKYFKTTDLIQKNISDEYYLEKQKEKKK